MMRGKKERKILFWTVLAPTQKKKNSPFTIIIRKEAEKKEAEPKEEL